MLTRLKGLVDRPGKFRAGRDVFRMLLDAINARSDLDGYGPPRPHSDSLFPATLSMEVQPPGVGRAIHHIDPGEQITRPLLYLPRNR